MKASIQVIVLLLLLSVVPLAEGEFSEGVLETPGSWSFVAGHCGCPPCDTGCSTTEANIDFELGFVFDPPLGWALLAPWGVAPLGEGGIDDVEKAPISGYFYAIAKDENEEVGLGRLYVLRTFGGGHVLVRPTIIASPDYFVFEFKYQPDGSGVFSDRTPVRSASWGAVKKRGDSN